MSNVTWKGKEISAIMKKAGINGLKDAAEFVLDKTLQVVPIDEGTLANSGNTSVDDSSMTSTVFYDSPYAIKQHEDLTLTHKNGRTAKYLENPLNENSKKIQQIIADAIKGVL